MGGGGGDGFLKSHRNSRSAPVRLTHSVSHRSLCSPHSTTQPIPLSYSVSLTGSSLISLSRRNATLALALLFQFEATVTRTCSKQPQHADDSPPPFADSIEPEMQKWFRRALFPILTSITVDAFDNLKAFEVYPCKLPDLLVECPLVISGRYEGKFPSTVKAKGRSADENEVVVNLKVQNSADIPIEKVFAKQQLDLLTAQAWFFESKQLEDKHEKKHDEKRRKRAKDEAETLVHYVRLGFGNPIATVENIPPGSEGTKQADTFAVFEKAVSCCSGFCDCYCCVCCIKSCSEMNDQCAIALTQLCMALYWKN